MCCADGVVLRERRMEPVVNSVMLFHFFGKCVIYIVIGKLDRLGGTIKSGINLSMNSRLYQYV